MSKTPHVRLLRELQAEGSPGRGAGMAASPRAAATLLIGGAALIVAGLTFGPPSVDAAPPPQDARGKADYEAHCSVCHGTQGRGDGAASYLLRPRPRDFATAQFRLVSTENAIVSRDDILRVVREGMPGTGMPSWAHLSDETLGGIVDHVLELERAGMRDVVERWNIEEEEEMEPEEIEEIVDIRTKPGAPLAIPPEPPVSVESVARGRLVFVSQCAKCHGVDGRGMTDPEWKSAEGFPMWSRDLLSGIFKGGRESESLYRRVWLGIPGSPMPAHKHLPVEDMWGIVHYVQSLSNPISQELVRIKQERIDVPRVDALPASPTDAAWRDVPATRVALMPLFWRDEFRDAVLARAVHDGKKIQILIQWEDPSRDTGGLRQTEFPDGAAVQLSDADEAPLFTMGDPEHRVNIWHWKALWDEDAEAFRDVTSVFPRAVTDGYYGRKKGWGAKPLDDPLYRPAAERGNPLSRTGRKTPVEDANAERFGSLSTQPPEDQNVGGTSSWNEGVWSLVLERDLVSPSDRDVKFTPGGEAFCAFAIWNGSIGDRDGQKSISIWNVLRLAK